MPSGTALVPICWSGGCGAAVRPGRSRRLCGVSHLGRAAVPWRELHVLRDASSRLAGGSRRGTYWQRGCRRGAASAAARCEEVRPICLLRSAARRTTYLYLYLSCLYITAWGCNQLSLRLRPTLTDPTYPELALDYLCTKSTKHLNILEIRNLAPISFAWSPLTSRLTSP